MSVFVIKKPVTQVKESNQEGTKKVEDNSQVKVNDNQEVSKDKKIVIDGPLSRVYTDALNAVYANESASNQFISIINKELELDDLKAPTELYSTDGQVKTNEGSDLYVYTIKTDNMKPSDSISTAKKLQLALQADNGKGKVCLAVESASVVPSHVDTLIKMTEKEGVKVLWTRNQALETMKDALS